MTDRSKLLALADAVEKLTGPDRETDARIAHAIKWRWDDWVEGDLRIESYTVEAVIDRVQKNSHNSIWQHIPRFTGSLDAAMTLVPDGWGWTVGDKSPEPSLAWCEIDHLPWQEGYGWAVERKLIVQSATPAIAGSAAALRAQAEALA